MQAGTQRGGYLFTIGIVVGSLLSGLLVPLIFGDSATATPEIVAGPTTPVETPTATTGGAATTTTGSDAGTTGTGTGSAVTTTGATTTGGTSGGTTTGSGGTTGTSGATSGTTGTPGTTGTGGASATTGPTGPATGEPIPVGVLHLDIGNVSALGFPGTSAVEDRVALWDFLAARYNEAGGVNGRPVGLLHTTYDPLSEQSMRESCLHMTEDNDVFVATASGGFIGAPMLCFTEEHNTPFVVSASSGVPQDYFARSKGLLFTTFMGSNRMVDNLVEEVVALGALDGKRVGLLFDLRSGPDSIPKRMEANLKARGITVSHTSIFSADVATASSQVPVEVQQHIANTTEVIINMAQALAFTQFVQDASSQGFNPPYFNSDWNGANSDFYYSNLPASYDGNLNFTIFATGDYRVDNPEPEIDRQCREDVKASTGIDLTRDHGDERAFALECAFFQLVTLGLERAGSELTNDSFSGAMQGLGELSLPAFGKLIYRPGQFDAAYEVRTMRWQADCTCIVPITPFRPSRF